MQMSEEIRVDDKDRRIVCNLYWDQKTIAKVRELQTDYQRIRCLQGVNINNSR